MRIPIIDLVLGLVILVIYIVPLAISLYYNTVPAFDYYNDVLGSIEVSGALITGVDRGQRVVYVSPSDSFTVKYKLKLPVREFYTSIALKIETDAYAYVLSEMCGLSDVAVREDEIAVTVFKTSKDCNMSVIVNLDIRAGLLREYIGRLYPVAIGQYKIRDSLAIKESSGMPAATSIEIKPLSCSYSYSTAILIYIIPLIVLAALLPIVISIRLAFG